LAAGSEELPQPLRSRLVVWELPSGKERPLYGFFPGGVKAVAFAPDSRTLVAGGANGWIEIVDTAHPNKGGRTIDSITWGIIGAPVSGLSFGADSRALAIAYLNGKIFVCDSATGKLIRPLETQGYVPNWNFPPGTRPLAFSPDGLTLAAGGRQQVVHLLTVASGKQRLLGELPTP
jgi:WD40 repeat protein